MELKELLEEHLDPELRNRIHISIIDMVPSGGLIENKLLQSYGAIGTLSILRFSHEFLLWDSVRFPKQVGAPFTRILFCPDLRHGLHHAGYSRFVMSNYPNGSSFSVHISPWQLLGN